MAAVNYEGLVTQIQPRRDGHYSAKIGQSFSTAHQTPSTDVTGQTSFDATTPTFLFNQAAAANRILLRDIQLTMVGTVAGAITHVALAIDTANRYSAGGTAVVPQNTNRLSSVAAGVTFRYNPTATAPGSGTRYLKKWGVAALLGTMLNRVFDDEIIIGATGSILVYTWAATTGPTWAFSLGHLEEPA